MRRVAATYERPIVAASMAALLELVVVLRSYRGAIILVGGWVPYILLRDHGAAGNAFEHIGSLDIDLVVDSSRISAERYSTIVGLIQDRG